MASNPPSGDDPLRELVNAIVSGHLEIVSRLLNAAPALAMAPFQTGATRQNPKEHYLQQIGTYIYAGDTALHIAAAGYRDEIVRSLIGFGAAVRAKNSHGAEPLHYASSGQPGSPKWNPRAQAATIAALIEAGADPNATDKRGVTPLHRAVRTRSANAVRTLLDHGADPARKNKSGSTPVLLAAMTTGRGGSGLPQAKAEQNEILRIFSQLGVRV